MLRVLKQLDGNKTRAAQMLGIDRRTFHRKLAQFEMNEDLAEAQGNADRTAAQDAPFATLTIV
jgi:hypothetical protein